jgi:hypothetical protein
MTRGLWFHSRLLHWAQTGSRTCPYPNYITGTGEGGRFTACTRLLPGVRMSGVCDFTPLHAFVTRCLIKWTRWFRLLSRTQLQLDSKGLCRWCITLRITGFLHFVQNSKYKKTHRFGKWICFRSQVRWGEVREQWLRLALAKGPNRVDVKVRGFFRLRNVNMVGFYYLLNCYMFRSYDHIQAEMYLLELTLP